MNSELHNAIIEVWLISRCAKEPDIGFQHMVMDRTTCKMIATMYRTPIESVVSEVEDWIRRFN